MSLNLTKQEFDLQSKAIDRAASRHRLWFGLVSLGIALYLLISYISFDIPTVISKLNPERASLYMLDTYAHKDHVTMRWQEPENVQVALEGGFRSVYTQDNLPDWFSDDGETRIVTFPNEGVITIKPTRVFMDWPGYDETFEFGLNAGGSPVVFGYEGREDALPDFMRVTKTKVEVRPSLMERLQVGTSKVEVHRYKYGWEYFWFDFNSPLRDYTIWQGLGLIFAGERLTETMTDDQLDAVNLESGQSISNLALVFGEIRHNQIWGHGIVFWALLETVFMALLGTMLAAGVGLPLAFLAARNVQSETANRVVLGALALGTAYLTLRLAAYVFTATTFNGSVGWSLAGFFIFLVAAIFTGLATFKKRPIEIIRFVTRRSFDLLRGIDTLIWSLIFLRAFGPGLFTGIFAIAFTDTGTLGKLMSEAVENADAKQREGVQSTGASKVQQHRFGILPQIMPVFISQSLYYLESNTRGAVIIGAMGAGGIGLQFLGALNTRNNFEMVAYLAILVLIVVVLMDWMSAKVRRALIGSE
ncbi:MAG: ABC transporter permease subunit [Pseudomonadota bacterium]